MNSSRIALKRARPALGSILLMRLEAPAGASEAAIDEVLGRAFEYTEELEGKFSKFREASEVSRLNQASVGREIPVSREFMELMHLAQEIWSLSNGAFAPWDGADNPFALSESRANYYAEKTREAVLDLSGIAKGFVVDRVANRILAEIPGLSGVLNAGGDLKFLGETPRLAEVRLAHGTEALSLEITDDALATSAMSEFLHTPESTTVYSKAPRAGLSAEHVVSAMASTCAAADALTKVGWFASADAAERTAEAIGGKILIFDQNGAISQSFGKK